MSITRDDGPTQASIITHRTVMAPHKDFAFVGRLCLDFAQTGDMGWGERYERLTDRSALERWIGLSPLKLERVHVTHTELARAKALRGAIWRTAQLLLAGDGPRVRDVARLNAGARRATLVRALATDAASTYWHRPTAAAALAAIAQDAIALFGDPLQRARLRRCANAECRVVFYDDSRPGSRRWCFANRCGDRIRAREYRHRHA